MKVLAGKYLRDKIFFWVGKSTQTHRGNSILLCLVGKESWILHRSDLGDSLLTSFLPEHSAFFPGLCFPQFPGLVHISTSSV